MANLTVVAANVRAMAANGAITRIGTAGGTITVGACVYLAADGHWEVTDASVVGTAFGKGIAVEGYDSTTSIVAGEPVTVCLLGPVEGFTGLTPDSKAWVSDDAGLLEDAAGTIAHELGWALSATAVFVNPDAAGGGS